LGKIDEQILEVLQKAGKPMTLTEIAEQADKPPKKIFSGLRKLFEAGKVSCDHKARTYALVKEQ
jgi:DNA-binding IclR family transcriptional regulator